MNKKIKIAYGIAGGWVVFVAIAIFPAIHLFPEGYIAIVGSIAALSFAPVRAIQVERTKSDKL